MYTLGYFLQPIWFFINFTCGNFVSTKEHSPWWQKYELIIDFLQKNFENKTYVVFAQTASIRHSFGNSIWSFLGEYPSPPPLSVQVVWEGWAQDPKMGGPDWGAASSTTQPRTRALLRSKHRTQIHPITSASRMELEEHTLPSHPPEGKKKDEANTEDIRMRAGESWEPGSPWHWLHPASLKPPSSLAFLVKRAN